MNCDGGLGRLSDIKDVRGKARLITNSTVNKSMYNSSVDWQGNLSPSVLIFARQISQLQIRNQPSIWRALRSSGLTSCSWRPSPRKSSSRRQKKSSKGQCLRRLLQYLQADSWAWSPQRDWINTSLLFWACLTFCAGLASPKSPPRGSSRFQMRTKPTKLIETLRQGWNDRKPGRERLWTSVGPRQGPVPSCAVIVTSRATRIALFSSERTTSCKSPNVNTQTF